MEPATAPQADMAPELTPEEEQVNGPAVGVSDPPRLARPSPRGRPRRPRPCHPSPPGLPGPKFAQPLASGLASLNRFYFLPCEFVFFRTGNTRVGRPGSCGDLLLSRVCTRSLEKSRGLRAAWAACGHIVKGAGLPILPKPRPGPPVPQARRPTVSRSGLHLSGACVQLHCPLTLGTVISQKEVVCGVILRALVREKPGLLTPSRTFLRSIQGPHLLRKMGPLPAFPCLSWHCPSLALEP